MTEYAIYYIRHICYRILILYSTLKYTNIYIFFLLSLIYSFVFSYPSLSVLVRVVLYYVHCSYMVLIAYYYIYIYVNVCIIVLYLYIGWSYGTCFLLKVTLGLIMAKATFLSFRHLDFFRTTFQLYILVTRKKKFYSM